MMEARERAEQLVEEALSLIREISEEGWEAVEEADCRLGRVVQAHAFLPSPGGSSERVVVFCGEADLAGAGGIHGLADEHENIRVEVYPADEAIRLLDEGRIEAGPAVVALSWFARHRDRLKREWLA